MPTAWGDLPANVNIEDRPDGWSVDQEKDVIDSVQASLHGQELVIELWGHTTAISPDGVRHDEREFQQDARIELGGRTWHVRRLVRDLGDEFPLEGLPFELEGTVDSVAKHRRF